MKIKLLRYAEESTNMLKLVKKISPAIFERTGKYPENNLKCSSVPKVSWL